MNEILNAVLFNWHVNIDWWIIHLHGGGAVTGWKLIGWFGAGMFGGRWAVQALASHFAKRPVLPIIFWYMSFVGSACVLSYYIWGKNDSVGILLTAFPCMFTLYNIFLHYTYKRRTAHASAG